MDCFLEVIEEYGFKTHYTEARLVTMVGDGLCIIPSGDSLFLRLLPLYYTTEL